MTDLFSEPDTIRLPSPKKATVITSLIEERNAKLESKDKSKTDEELKMVKGLRSIAKGIKVPSNCKAGLFAKLMKSLRLVQSVVG